MLATLTLKAASECVPVTPLTASELPGWLENQLPTVVAWVKAAGFKAEAGAVLLIPGEGGALIRVLAGVADGLEDIWALAHLPATLPPATYRLDPEPRRLPATRAALGWALGGYRFDRYRKSGKPVAALRWPKHADRGAVDRMASAIALVRDLVNTPANDLGPAELAEAARALASEFEAGYRCVVGQDLLSANYPAIHAVGRASPRVPRLIDITWGNPENPKITLVGKGVCFDSGGLDLKPSGNMLLMKKDMGGAAHALAVARMVMMAGLSVRLRVLIPVVENVVAGNAMKPLDVLKTRKGLTVEVGNTDAEGRLILADALAEAASEKPALIVDFATLTGAARAALGPEVPAMFSNDDRVASDLETLAQNEADPLWRMPLWPGYRKALESKIADLSSTGNLATAGAVTAALFLENFVDQDTPWVHLDIFAWNSSARPGRPEGGEAMAIRAVYALIEKHAAKG